jgi:hypothetical protein
MGCVKERRKKFTDLLGDRISHTCEEFALLRDVVRAG